MTKIQRNGTIPIVSDKKNDDPVKNLGYLFHSNRINPEYTISALVPLRGSLIRNKSKFDLSKIEGYFNNGFPDIPMEPEYFVSGVPKYQTLLLKPVEVDTETGEIRYEEHQTDDFKRSNYRRIKRVQAFSNAYEPLYRSKKVSILMHTLTRINFAIKDISEFIENVKDRYGQINRQVLGYIWIAEVGEKTNMIHYHIAVAVPRFKVERMPLALKMDDLWGQMTQVQFVRKSVTGYLAKYMIKSNELTKKILKGFEDPLTERLHLRAIRSFGSSQQFKTI